MRARLLVSTRDQLIATWRSVVILEWRIDTTMAGVRTLQDVYDAHAQANPGGIFLFTVVDQNAPLPPPEVRVALAKFLASGSGRTILSAVVHEGAGFRAAAVRSVVTGLALLSKLPYPHKVFANVESGVNWFQMSSATVRSWGESALIDTIAEVRANVAKAATG